MEPSQQEKTKGKGKGKGKEEGKDAGSYEKWTVEESNELLQTLIEAAKRGWRDPQSGLIDKKTVLLKILPVFNKKLGCEKTYENYFNRVKWLKKQYVMYTQLMRHSSGFGWDLILKKITASNEVWEDYFKAHPNHRGLRTQTYVDYEDLKLAVGNGTATGKFSISLGDETDATTYVVEDSESGALNDLVFNQNANAFIPAEVESSFQVHPPPSSPLSFQEKTVEASDNIKEKPKENSGTGKRNRKEYEKNSNSVEENSEADFMKKLSLGIGSIATNFNKMYDLMEKRESRDTECWDAIKNTPGLDVESRYKALELLNTKALKDVFLNMTSEERFEWISFKTMH